MKACGDNRRLQQAASLGRRDIDAVHGHEQISQLVAHRGLRTPANSHRGWSAQAFKPSWWPALTSFNRRTTVSADALLQPLELSACHHVRNFSGSNPMRQHPRHELIWHNGHFRSLLGGRIRGVVSAPRVARVSLCLELRARQMAGNP